MNKINILATITIGLIFIMYNIFLYFYLEEIPYKIAFIIFLSSILAMVLFIIYMERIKR